MRKLSGLLVLVLLVLTLSSLGFAQNILKVATEAGFMPFEYVSEDGQLLGFDTDLIRAIGEELDMEIQIDNISWDGLIPALLNNSYDAIIAGITITPERTQSVSFSDPYFESVLTIVSKEGQADLDLDSLMGKVAAVQISTTGDFITYDISDLGDVLRYNTVAEAMQNVIMGTADCVIIDLPVAEAYLANNSTAPLKHVGPVSDNEYYGIAVNQNNTDVLDKINTALAELHSNGIYDELYQKWFSN